MYEQIAAALHGEAFTMSFQPKTAEVTTFNGAPLDTRYTDCLFQEMSGDDDFPEDIAWLNDGYLDSIPVSHSGGTPVKTWWRHGHVKTGLEIGQRARSTDRIYSTERQPYDKGASHSRSVKKRAIRFGRKKVTLRGHFWPEDLVEPHPVHMFPGHYQ